MMSREVNIKPKYSISFFQGDWSSNYFKAIPPTSYSSRPTRAVVSYWQKDVH